MRRNLVTREKWSSRLHEIIRSRIVRHLSLRVTTIKVHYIESFLTPLQQSTRSPLTAESDGLGQLAALESVIIFVARSMRRLTLDFHL